MLAVVCTITTAISSKITENHDSNHQPVQIRRHHRHTRSISFEDLKKCSGRMVNGVEPDGLGEGVGKSRRRNTGNWFREDESSITIMAVNTADATVAGRNHHHRKLHSCSPHSKYFMMEILLPQCAQQTPLLATSNTRTYQHADDV
jgi:hypothetical protein